MKRPMALLLIAGALMAGECTYRVKNIEVGWEAFKTPMKVGVKGKFDAIKLTAKPADTIDGLLEGSKVTIDTRSVDSGNKGRDTKLVTSFFKVQGAESITAEIEKIDGNIAQVAITMNGVTKRVPMKIEREDDGMKIAAEGVLDLGDFKMLPSLTSLTKACYDKHQGKTWQDVDISFEIETKKKCKD